MTWGFWRHLEMVIDPSRDFLWWDMMGQLADISPGFLICFIGVPRFDCLTYDLCTTETFTGNIKFIMLVGCTSVILHIPGMLLVWSGYRTLYRTLYSSSSSSDTHRNEQNIPESWHVSWVSKLCVCLCVYVLYLPVYLSLSLYYTILSYLIWSYLICLSFYLFYMYFSYAYVL